MNITKDTVKYAANLARMELQPDELEKLSGQLQEVLDFIDKLKKADVAKIGPTSHILAKDNCFREDEPKESLSPEKALQNAPLRNGNFFVVPKVIE